LLNHSETENYILTVNYHAGYPGLVFQHFKSFWHMIGIYSYLHTN